MSIPGELEAHRQPRLIARLYHDHERLAIGSETLLLGAGALMVIQDTGLEAM